MHCMCASRLLLSTAKAKALLLPQGSVSATRCCHFVWLNAREVSCVVHYIVAVWKPCWMPCACNLQVARPSSVVESPPPEGATVGSLPHSLHNTDPLPFFFAPFPLPTPSSLTSTGGPPGKRMEEFPAAPEEVLVLQERVSEAQRLATMVREPAWAYSRTCFHEACFHPASRKY